MIEWGIIITGTVLFSFGCLEFSSGKENDTISRGIDHMITGIMFFLLGIVQVLLG